MSVPAPDLVRPAEEPARFELIVVLPEAAETVIAEEEVELTVSVLDPVIETSELK